MNTALIVAAGKSTRYSKYKDKLLEPILGFPLIYYSIQAFNDHPLINQVYIVTNSSNKKKIANMVKKYHFNRVKAVILGGKERQDSVLKGLKALKNPNKKDLILVHNGANPLVTEKEISECIKQAQKHGAAAVGRKIVDTVKEIKAGHIVKTHDRRKLVGMQTPQVIRYDLLEKAFKKAAKTAKRDQQLFTDEASMLENVGLKVKLVPASPHNHKVTTEDDLEKARHLMGDTPNGFLVGIGQDSHKFAEGEEAKQGLFLGGIHLKDYPKLEADSDGDVVLHALYNAISQALGEGSLGRFATHECKVKGVKSSVQYLKPLFQKLKRKKYTINNIGIMLECARPKIDLHAAKLKKSISTIAGLPTTRVGITATTGEKLTEFGKGKGIQCFAIVSIKKELK